MQTDSTEIKLTDKYGASETRFKIFIHATNDFPPKFVARFQINAWGPRYVLNDGKPIEAEDILDVHIAVIKKIKTLKRGFGWRYQNI